MSDARPTNRLAAEKSPYLLQHAHNPVDWHPWGEEAFARARSENRPLFVSIGYSTCHWCHVMERESFEDPETARVMNELYVNVKVDREERPDVDQIYMQAVTAMTGHGGWPLSIWLTPDLRPFYGGTYYPPDRRWGRPSFREVLLGVAQLYRSRPADVERSATQLMEVLNRGGAGRSAGEAIPEDLPLTLEAELEKSFDARFGGFGGAPKFPRPVALSFLVGQAIRQQSGGARQMVEKTLEMMWRGGIYDHVGGGFARYAVDERWLVPHFEKMLYDQAQLVHAYLDGFALTQRDDFAAVARDVLAFVEREMTHPEGGFYSGQDADSEGIEGKFYVFTLDDLRSALGADAETAAKLYGATEEGNFEGANILHWPRPPSEAASLFGLTNEQLRTQHQDFRQRLYAWREARVRPGLDDKILTSWNGLMIGAFARAGAVLDHAPYIAAARKAARFLDTRVRSADGTLLRRWRDGEARFEACLEDHAFLASGLLSLFEATGEADWLHRAAELLQEMDSRYSDGQGAYYFAAKSPDLPARLKDAYDGALPSGNSVAALLWGRVGSVLGREDYRGKGLHVVETFAPELTSHPEAYPLMIGAFQELREPPRTLQIRGDSASTVYRGLFQRAHREPYPGRVIIPAGEPGFAALQALGVPLYGDDAAVGEGSALLCEEATCRPWGAKV